MIERYMVSTPTAKSNDNPQKGNARGLPGPKVATGCQQRRAHTPYRAWLNPYELLFPGGRNGIATERYMVSTATVKSKGTDVPSPDGEAPPQMGYPPPTRQP